MADMGAFGTGFVLGALDGMNENAIKANNRLRAQIDQLTEALNAEKSRNAKLTAKYQALVARFAKERGSLLATARMRRYIRLVAHELSGVDYDQIDANAESAFKERRSPEIEQEQRDLSRRLVDEDHAEGVEIWERKKD